MAIEKYTTSAIVIESFDQSEHDRVYKLFTREFGLITAHAKSVRKLESKLRAHVLPRSVALVTLVRGRDVWRLVGAEEKKNTSGMIYEVSQLIRRFIRGEGSHKALYDRLIEFLTIEKTFDKQQSRLLIYFILLVELGYADAKIIGVGDIKEYINWNVQDLYTHLLLSYEKVRAHVHDVLKETQL